MSRLLIVLCLGLICCSAARAQVTSGYQEAMWDKAGNVVQLPEYPMQWYGIGSDMHAAVDCTVDLEAKGQAAWAAGKAVLWRCVQMIHQIANPADIATLFKRDSSFPQEMRQVLWDKDGNFVTPEAGMKIYHLAGQRSTPKNCHDSLRTMAASQNAMWVQCVILP